jgi:hypothetical protein
MVELDAQDISVSVMRNVTSVVDQDVVIALSVSKTRYLVLIMIVNVRASGQETPVSTISELATFFATNAMDQIAMTVIHAPQMPTRTHKGIANARSDLVEQIVLFP